MRKQDLLNCFQESEDSGSDSSNPQEITNVSGQMRLTPMPLMSTSLDSVKRLMKEETLQQSQRLPPRLIIPAIGLSISYASFPCFLNSCF